jgi:hypothetical protein
MAEPTAAPVPAHRHRRTYLVDRAFQLKYTFLLIGAGLALALVFGFWIYQAHAQAIELMTVDPALRPVLERGDRQLVYVFLGIAALMAAALGLIGVILTHRVAGPIFVMGHYMSVLAEGRYPRMRTLRKSDELKSFFDIFLRAVDRLKEREAAHAAMLEDAVARIEAAGVRSPEVETAVRALAAAARERRLAMAADPEPTPLYVPQPAAGGSEETG